MTRMMSIGLALSLALAGSAGARADEPDETLRLPGLSEAVEVVVDRWGVPHIYAQNEADLFMAQGCYAARDRLFQFELWRRQATGTVAEILGERELERDTGARLLRFRGDMRRELNHYHPRGELIITSFVQGINAWIEHTERHPELLPIEFGLLGIRPGRWTPEVVVSRHQGLMHNLTQELSLARAHTLLGEEKLRELVWFHPGEPKLELDAAIDGQLLFADILARYTAARSPIRFQPEDVLPQFRAASSATPARGTSQSAERWRGDESDVFKIDGRDIGSNNWVVAGQRTLSGSSIMANDPHRVLQTPSLRYFVHLHAPGWNVIGGGEPTLPGISIGHNGCGAWGLTIFRIDAEDLYVYQLHPEDSDRYKYRDGWEAMQVVRETIPVKGGEPVEVLLKFTRHGPVLFEDPQNRVAYALRAGWLEVGGAPYLASLRMNAATDWEEFREACTYSHIPGENMVWADREGNIGWQAVGIAPLRPNWDGLLPVPGDGRYEWSGYLPGRELPHVFNPAKGFWNTSNEDLVPPGYAHRPAVGWTWADPFRGARVGEVLASGRKLSRTDMMLLQQDELSIPARSLIPLLRDLQSEDEQVRQAIARLQSWDFVLDRDSIPAGIYAMWERRLQANIKNLLVPEAATPHIDSIAVTRIIDLLLSPDGGFGESPLAGRDALLLTSLSEALQQLSDALGPEMGNWKYGQPGYKHALVRHPLSPAVNDQLRGLLDVGPLPRGGNSFTVNNTGGGNNQPTGGSFRVIVDTGDWDGTLASNSPGQGGDPHGPHYRDLFESWAQGRYFPLFYSRSKIDSVRVRTLCLTPLPQSPTALPK